MLEILAAHLRTVGFWGEVLDGDGGPWLRIRVPKYEIDMYCINQQLKLFSKNLYHEYSEPTPYLETTEIDLSNPDSLEELEDYFRQRNHVYFTKS